MSITNHQVLPTNGLHGEDALMNLLRYFLKNNNNPFWKLINYRINLSKYFRK
jgi:hypothetical protein